uniref:Uncharacterized protein n=1 Tax=Aegilops tauschii subsp. strangulata TaxID=200361 RepID=A0A453K1E3_AEGTS
NYCCYVKLLLLPAATTALLFLLMYSITTAGVCQIAAAMKQSESHCCYSITASGLLNYSSDQLIFRRRSSRHGVLQERIMPNRTTPRTWPWIKLLHPGAGACDVRRGEAI